MAEPWLPDTSLTSPRTAEPISRVVADWATAWFKSAPWQTLGGWDEVFDTGTDQFSLLRRSRGIAIKGKPSARTSLAFAILGEDERVAQTEYDTGVLEILGERAVEDLEKRLSQSLPGQDTANTSTILSPCPRVFSILIGKVGEAQLAIECALAELVAMARSTYPSTAQDLRLIDRRKACDGVTINVTVRLGSASISLKDLGSLETGDLLMLDSGPTELATLMVDDRATSLSFSISETDNSCVLEFQEDQ